MHEEINQLDPDQLLNTSVETAVQHFIDKNAIEVPMLDRAEVVIDPAKPREQSTVPLTTTEIDVTVPFRGAVDAFSIRPSTFRVSSPLADVASGYLTFTVSAYKRDHLKGGDTLRHASVLGSVIETDGQAEKS